MNRIIKTVLFLLPFYGFGASAQVATPAPGSSGQILINAPPPAIQHVMGDTGYNLFFAASNGPNFDNEGLGQHFLSSAFRLIDASNYAAPAALIFLDISTNSTLTAPIVITLGIGTNAGNEIPLTGASVVDQTVNNQAPALCSSTSNCVQGVRNGANPFLSAYYSPGSVVRVSFLLSDLCATTQSSGTNNTQNTNICPFDSTNNFAGTNGAGTTSLSEPIYVSFSTLPAATSASPFPIGSISNSPVNTTIYLTDVAPTIARPSSLNVEDFYAPADGAILITADNYDPAAGAATNGNPGAPVQNLIILADQNSAPAITTDALPTGINVATMIAGSGPNLSAGGFVNSTCVGFTCTPAYNGAFYAMDSSGIFSAVPVTINATTPLPEQGDIEHDGLLHAEAVFSVLTKSKCFIATAAFHDGDAAPVVMLRKFRDKILAKSQIGREFIQNYYKYSPPLAEWAWDKPIIRSIALHALAPVEFVAWAILKLTHAEEISSQPYIDRVKKKLETDDLKTPETTESYSESIKKTLPPVADDTESYSEREKKRLNLKRDESSQDYSKKVKEELPPETDTDSTIAKVKEGRDKRPEPPHPPITTAFSAKFGLSPGVKVTNTDPDSVNFQDMYGNGSSWQPDLVLHYERQYIHSENFGSLAFQADFGISYAEGYGQYQYGFGSTNSKQSKTKFSFVQFPITVGGIYRFNLARLFRPYVGIGIGTMVYTEIRSDDNPDKHGETPIYEGELGMAFLLDYFDKSTARDGFLSSGIQHSYIFAEYMRMNSFSQSGVTFERSGIYLGFLVEY